MANNCDYTAFFTSKRKESLQRMLEIMQYRDPQYHLYRVFDAEDYNGIEELPDGFFRISVCGDVAWGPSPWIDAEPRYDEESGKKYTNLLELSKTFGFAFEVFASEAGMMFGEYLSGYDGRLACREECRFRDSYLESEEDLDEVVEDLKDNGIPCPEDVIEELKEDLSKYGSANVWGGGFYEDPHTYDEITRKVVPSIMPMRID